MQYIFETPAFTWIIQPSSHDRAKWELACQSLASHPTTLSTYESAEEAAVNVSIQRTGLDDWDNLPPGDVPPEIELIGNWQVQG